MKLMLVLLTLVAISACANLPQSSQLGKQVGTINVDCGTSTIKAAIVGVGARIAAAFVTGDWWAALDKLIVDLGAGTYACAAAEYQREHPTFASLAAGGGGREPTISEKIGAHLAAHHLEPSRR